MLNLSIQIYLRIRVNICQESIFQISRPDSTEENFEV